MKCNICNKQLKENTEGNDRYCQGHDLLTTEDKKINFHIRRKENIYKNIWQ